MPHKRAREEVTHPSIPSTIIGELAKLQDALNKFIDLDWRTKRTADDWGLAVTLESAELIDSYPWKWWKNVNASPDFKNVRVELVDILHFSLSGTMQVEGTAAASTAVPSDIDCCITGPLAITKNAVRTFRNVIYLAKLHRFDFITAMVIAAAQDLEFNLVGYYVAKHTLNYIRQLSGYKAGTYQKVKQGQEDNELLHSCLSGVSMGDMVDESTHVAAWNSIMVAVYDAFNVAAADRHDVAHWIHQAASPAAAAATVRAPEH